MILKQFITNSILVQPYNKREKRDKNIDSIDYGQIVYQIILNWSVKRMMLTKEIRETILHYYKKKFLSEMMVTKKVKVGI